MPSFQQQKSYEAFKETRTYESQTLKKKRSNWNCEKHQIYHKDVKVAIKNITELKKTMIKEIREGMIRKLHLIENIIKEEKLL